MVILGIDTSRYFPSPSLIVKVAIASSDDCTFIGPVIEPSSNSPWMV